MITDTFYLVHSHSFICNGKKFFVDAHGGISEWNSSLDYLEARHSKPCTLEKMVARNLKNPLFVAEITAMDYRVAKIVEDEIAKDARSMQLYKESEAKVAKWPMQDLVDELSKAPSLGQEMPDLRGVRMHIPSR